MVAIARVHVDDYDPEVYTGENALEYALIVAKTCREDFPEAVVGVSYNPQAAQEKMDRFMKSLGVED